MRRSQHVFISYVRENKRQVDLLFDELTSKDVSVWLDRKEIAPGQRWKPAIRQAIKDGAFFIACFSKESVARSKTYMNEELNLAIDELRLRPVNKAWFIPIRLSPCDVPDRAIGAGETLSDIQWVDLHSDWRSGVDQIVHTVSNRRKPRAIAEQARIPRWHEKEREAMELAKRQEEEQKIHEQSVWDLMKRTEEEWKRHAEERNFYEYWAGRDFSEDNSRAGLPVFISEPIVFVFKSGLIVCFLFLWMLC